MTRYIDADVMKESIIAPRSNGKALISEWIDAQPTVDAVPVVRCVECYFWDKGPSQTAMPEVHTCRYWRIGTTCIDYCARASRDGWLKAMSGEVKNDRQR